MPTGTFAAPRANAAIVTTLRDAGEIIDSFVAYHLAIGFAHLFLFFDDPADPDAYILHYACCGFENFWTKYRILGRFADRWLEKDDIRSAIGPLHLDARDVVAAGNWDAALAFYRHRLAIEDGARAEALIGHGVLLRIPQPR